MTERFNNRSAQLAMMGFGALIAVIGFGGISEGELAGTVYLAFGLFTAWRGRNASSVTVNDSEVVTRSMVRTRRFPLSELLTVDVRIGRTGLNGSDREYLVLQGTDGSEFEFKELNARPCADGTVVRRAAAAIARFAS